ncbi:MAG TPA: hypothetical protein VLA89_14140 [Gemmatimonadales bacterium]|nr:hypothetical protein [Gemmatimonadales bacterium]
MGRELGITVITGPEWKRVVAALTRADEEMPGNFKDAIKDVAEKLADEARARVLALPTPSNAGHTGLRQKVAEGVHVIDRGNGGVRVITSMPTASESIIPRGLDRLKGWRHPLFGDKNHWFSNRGYSWFMSTFENGEELFENRLDHVLNKAAQDIADAAGLQAGI